ncbi:Uncharacterized conserved protein [Ceraceosorus bombacis]|uniref:tRNA (uracil-O(2)-)-methyltransferase n=1 Tax=Ceraceosorus bombacis TaxID=401625 RepID=A0A0P1BHI4_9BASI|nr:Uncharacterized conserved protein [Ceraceosorus bombacis]
MPKGPKGTEPKDGRENRVVPAYPPCNARLLVDGGGAGAGAGSTDMLEALDIRLSGLPLKQSDSYESSGRRSGEPSWKDIAVADMHTAVEHWESVMQALVEHPERSSSWISRADIVESHTYATPIGVGTTSIGQMRDAATSHRRNAWMGVQAEDASQHADESQLPLELPASVAEIPFYHPAVRAMAFQFHTLPEAAVSSSLPDQSLAVRGIGRISIVPFSSTSFPLQAADRLSRTALSLLTLQSKHAWGALHSYEKRVTHDRLVGKEEYMDTYSELKRLHAARLIDTWCEVTDADKHVFEDLGIAAWLMCLWKDMYAHDCPSSTSGETSTSADGKAKRPWDSWGRPPGGFVDVGCGNGLLVHILNAEGYTGYGFDLRARRSWDVHRRAPGGASLHVYSLDVPLYIASLLNSGMSDPSTNTGGILTESNTPKFLPGCFLIANHSDELTPWIPALAALIPGCSFANIPCCAWNMDGCKFGRTRFRVENEEVCHLLGLSKGSCGVHWTEETSAAAQLRSKMMNELVEQTQQALLLGPSNAGSNVTSTTSASRNIAYIHYISHLHLSAGFQIEKEVLRIPSTRNWALLGRRRTWELLIDSETEEEQSQRRKRVEDAVRARMTRDVECARNNAWKARIPEGNAGKNVH